MKMGPEGNILENFSISTFQQGLTHSAMVVLVCGVRTDRGGYKWIQMDTIGYRRIQVVGGIQAVAKLGAF